MTLLDLMTFLIAAGVFVLALIVGETLIVIGKQMKEDRRNGNR